MLRFNSIVIGSPKPEVLAEFYTKVFGKSADWSEGEWYGWKVGNSTFSIGPYSNVNGQARKLQKLIINYESADVKEDCERIKGLKVPAIKDLPKTEDPWIATFADADGNYFQIMSPSKT